MNEIMQSMLTRRSIRRYQCVPIPREHLSAIVACGINAPSGCNQQPWRFVVVDERELLERIGGLCRYGSFIAQAGACIAVFLAEKSVTPVEDCSAAAMNMISAAWSMGYGSCWIHSLNQPHSVPVSQALGAPTGWKLMALLSMGVPAEQPNVNKKSLEQVLFYNGVQ